MAQGEFKKRSGKFVTNKGKSKNSKKSKPLGPRKGGQYIAPKKATKAKTAKIKQQLTKQIGQKIEEELHQRAARAGNEFRILRSGEGTSASTSHSPSPSKGGKRKQKKED